VHDPRAYREDTCLMVDFKLYVIQYDAITQFPSVPQIGKADILKNGPNMNQFEIK